MQNITIFTDGSSRGNPGPGGWGAVVVIENENKIFVRELGGAEKHTTNNRMELTAAIEALSFIISHSQPQTTDYKMIVHTDSSYVVNGITKWVAGWEVRGWKTLQKEDVLNRDLWEVLAELNKDLAPQWKLVPGHSAVVGNERCDVIATAFADGEKIDLWNGGMEGYTIKNILDIRHSEEKRLQKNKNKNRSNTPAYSYVSMVDGKIETHATWLECEKRVKGAKGARFKKVFSAEEEKLVMAEFNQG